MASEPSQRGQGHTWWPKRPAVSLLTFCVEEDSVQPLKEEEACSLRAALVPTLNPNIPNNPIVSQQILPRLLCQM